MKVGILVFVILGIWIGLGVLSPATVQAELITIAIEAVVDDVQDPDNYLEGRVNLGDIITGSYIYDSHTPDSNPSITIGHYWHYDAPFGVSLTVGGFNFKTDSANVEFLLGVGNDGPSGDDIYWFTSHNNARLVNGTLVDSIWWQLNDSTGSALSSDALPTTFAFLGDWQANVLGIGADRRYGIFAHVTSAVPEPATIILFAFGAILLKKRK